MLQTNFRVPPPHPTLPHPTPLELGPRPQHKTKLFLKANTWLKSSPLKKASDQSMTFHSKIVYAHGRRQIYDFFKRKTVCYAFIYLYFKSLVCEYIIHA